MVYLIVFKGLNCWVEVDLLVCLKFVFVVEFGEYKSVIVKKVVVELFLLLKSIKIDMVILGCMYYLFLKLIIENFMGDGVVVINFGEEIVSEVSVLLDYYNLLDVIDEEIEYCFFIMGLI